MDQFVVLLLKGMLEFATCVATGYLSVFVSTRAECLLLTLGAFYMKNALFF